MTSRAFSTPSADMNREISRATCSRRIGSGTSSPATFGIPWPSQRAKTYSSASSMVGPQAEPPGEPLRHLAHLRERLARPRRRALDRHLDHLRAHLRRSAEPDVGSIELDHLCRVGRVDEIEGGPVRDVVAEQLRRLMSVRRAAGGVKQRDVVGVRQLLARTRRRVPRGGRRARRCASRARVAARSRGRWRSRARRRPPPRGSAARASAAPLGRIRGPPRSLRRTLSRPGS